MARDPLRIIIVDDDDLVLAVYERLLRGAGFVVRLAHDAEETLRYIETDAPDAVLIDLSMPDGSGMDLARRIHALGRPGSPVIVIFSGDFDRDRPSDCVEVAHYLPKDGSIEQFVAVLERHTPRTTTVAGRLDL